MSLFGFGTKKNKKENSVGSQGQYSVDVLLEDVFDAMI